MRVLFLLLISTVILFANIGKITAVKGTVIVERGAKQLKGASGFVLKLHDIVITKKKSRAIILFNDNTSITIGKNSKLSVDDFVLDIKKPKNSKANFGFKKGIFRTITGKIGKLNPSGFKLKTKSASIGIRGSDGITIVYANGGVKHVTKSGGFTLKDNMSGKEVYIPKGSTGVVTSAGITVTITTEADLEETSELSGENKGFGKEEATKEEEKEDKEEDKEEETKEEETKEEEDKEEKEKEESAKEEDKKEEKEKKEQETSKDDKEKKEEAKENKKEENKEEATKEEEINNEEEIKEETTKEEDKIANKEKRKKEEATKAKETNKEESIHNKTNKKSTKEETKKDIAPKQLFKDDSGLESTFEEKTEPQIESKELKTEPSVSDSTPKIIPSEPIILDIPVETVKENSTPVLVVENNKNIDESGTVTIRATATDSDGDVLTYAIVTAPSKGSATIDSSTGVITYTAPSNINNNIPDFMVISVTDGKETVTKTINFNIIAALKADSIISLLPNGEVENLDTANNDKIAQEIEKYTYDTTNDTYLEFGYWITETQQQIGTYINGTITPNIVIDDYIQREISATYNGKIAAFVKDISGEVVSSGGTVSLNLDFANKNVTGNINVDKGNWKANINSGDIYKNTNTNRYGFKSTDISSASNSSVADITGRIDGKFYGANANAVGGTFNLESNSAGSVSGVFGGKR